MDLPAAFYPQRIKEMEVLTYLVFLILLDHPLRLPGTLTGGILASHIIDPSRPLLSGGFLTATSKC